MIKLYGSGPRFGLPDASPFVTKVETLLRMAKLPFENRPMSFKKAPKGKIPYIDDDGALLGDSTFIRWHIERKYGIDFDASLDREQRATAWAFEKMMEDHFYWTILDLRWSPVNFERGPKEFFKIAPAPVRPLVVAMVRRKVRKAMSSQGMGRHSAAEIEQLGLRSIDAVANYLGDKPFFMGSEPTGVDAVVFAFAAGVLCPLFESPLQQAAADRPNLRRYVGRMTARYYPERSETAGCAAAA